MKLDVIKLDSGAAGSIDLADDIFGLEPRGDILQRVVRWQRAKAQAGTHSVLGKSDVSYSTKKIYRQKGTGGARHGSRKAPTSATAASTRVRPRGRTLSTCPRRSVPWVCVTRCRRRRPRVNWSSSRI